MKIYINKIPIEGLEINQTYDSNSLDLGTEEIKFVGPLNFSGWITKQEINLRIKKNRPSADGLFRFFF